MGQKIEGYWDCPYCGRTANRGSQRECPGCGKPRGSSTKFYMIEKDKFVPDSVVPKGPDWYCECCDSYNTYSARNCKSCGAPKGASKDYFQKRKEAEARERVTTHTTYYDDDSDSEPEPVRVTYGPKERVEEARILDDQPVSKPASSYTSPSSVSTRERPQIELNIPWKGIFIALLIALVVFGIVYACTPKEITLNVTEIAWQRDITIEEYRTVRESDWSVPTGGRVAYTQSEIHHYESVLDHYETRQVQRSETYISGYTTVTEYVDLGNGYFDTRTHQEPEYSTRYYYEDVQEPVYRQDPVYRTKYYYDIERWVYGRTERASGSSSTPYSLEREGYAHENGAVPYWPSFTLDSNERESGRTGRYTIRGYDVNDKNQKLREYAISYEEWQNIMPGDQVTGMVSLGSNFKLNE